MTIDSSHLKQGEIFVLLTFLLAVIVGFPNGFVRDGKGKDRGKDASGPTPVPGADDAGDERGKAQPGPSVTICPPEPTDPPGKYDRPMVVLSADDPRFAFDPDQAVIKAAFWDALEGTTLGQIERMAVELGCNALEIVGHTDEQHVSRQRKNGARKVPFSDEAIERGMQTPVSRDPGQGGIQQLEAISNAGLGYLRALAVMQVLQRQRSHGRLAKIDYFFPYSAGHLIRHDGSLVEVGSGKAELSRRRVEIRLFRYTPSP